MSIQDQLMADLKQALRDKDAVRKSAIRMAIAALKNARVEKKADLTDQEAIAVLSKEVKRRRDALAEFEKAERQDLADTETAEIEVLEVYLPPQLSEQEIVELVQEAIAQTGASSLKQMGQVMGAVMPRVQGRADGRQVSQIVRDLLRQDA